MNKIDEARALLKQLPPEKQDIAAEAILDFAADAGDMQLSERQVVDVQRRLADSGAKTITLGEFRSRIRKLVS